MASEAEIETRLYTGGTFQDDDHSRRKKTLKVLAILKDIAYYVLRDPDETTAVGLIENQVVAACEVPLDSEPCYSRNCDNASSNLNQSANGKESNEATAPNSGSSTKVKWSDWPENAKSAPDTETRIDHLYTYCVQRVDLSFQTHASLVFDLVMNLLNSSVKTLRHPDDLKAQLDQMTVDKNKHRYTSERCFH